MSGNPITATLIRPAAATDAAAVAAIYNHDVTGTIVTFEEQPGGVAAGYAYATRWRPRSGYRFSAEITVYLAPGQGGRGIGSRLYGELFPALRTRGIHAVMGGIALPNDASVL
jgi:phosphinothricin acetyltransferase